MHLKTLMPLCVEVRHLRALPSLQISILQQGFHIQGERMIQRTMSYNRAIIIDFSIEDLDITDDEVKKGSLDKKTERIKADKIKELIKTPLPEQTTRNEKESIRETPVTETFTDKQVPIDKSPPETIPTTSQKKDSGITAPFSAEGREDNIGMIGSSQKTDSRSVAKVTAEEARQRYLKEHFLYIRDIILKNISYPYMAKRMGWFGRVTISFVINEDGSVRDVRII